jgi:hypothetical protein
MYRSAHVGNPAFPPPFGVVAMLSRILAVSVMSVIGSGFLSADYARAAAKDAKEDAKAASEKPKSKPKAKSVARKGEARLTLPAHYRDVVTEDQRKEVATVFAKYNTKLAKLKAEIKSLTTERDQALEALLSKEQKEKLAQIKGAAKNRRAKPPAK